MGRATRCPHIHGGRSAVGCRQSVSFCPQPHGVRAPARPDLPGSGRFPLPHGLHLVTESRPRPCYCHDLPTLRLLPTDFGEIVDPWGLFHPSRGRPDLKHPFLQDGWRPRVSWHWRPWNQRLTHAGHCDRDIGARGAGSPPGLLGFSLRRSGGPAWGAGAATSLPLSSPGRTWPSSCDGDPAAG